jgi:hypothetical protein
MEKKRELKYANFLELDEVATRIKEKVNFATDIVVVIGNSPVILGKILEKKYHFNVKYIPFGGVPKNKKGCQELMNIKNKETVSRYTVLLAL